VIPSIIDETSVSHRNNVLPCYLLHVPLDLLGLVDDSAGEATNSIATCAECVHAGALIDVLFSSTSQKQTEHAWTNPRREVSTPHPKGPFVKRFHRRWFVFASLVFWLCLKTLLFNSLWCVPAIQDCSFGIHVSFGIFFWLPYGCGSVCCFYYYF